MSNTEKPLTSEDAKRYLNSLYGRCRKPAMPPKDEEKKQPPLPYWLRD